MLSHGNKNSSASVPPKWRFIAGCVLAPLLLVAVILIAFLAPSDWPAWKIYIPGVLMSLLAGAAVTLAVDGAIRLRNTQSVGKNRFILDVTGGIAAAGFVLVLFVKIISYSSPYEIRLYLTDERGRPVENARISVEGTDAITRKADHGWNLIVPASSKPPDGQFTIVASDPNAFLSARIPVILASALTQTISFQMTRDRSAVVSGKVVEEGTLNPLSGATVYVVGNEVGSMLTGVEGKFQVPANAGNGEPVQVHAEKYGYVTQEVSVPTDENVQIRLPRK